MKRTVPLCVLLCFYVWASDDQKTITADPGQNVPLPCRAPNKTIMIVEWSRPGLGTKHVLVYRNGSFLPEDQHPDYKNRVDLQDSQMKGGNLSVILKDVTTNDAGTYECRIFMEETQSWELISIINLRVAPPGQPGGTTEDGGKEDGGKEGGGKKDGIRREHFGLGAFGLFLILLVAVFVMAVKPPMKNSSQHHPTAAPLLTVVTETEMT